MAAARSCRTAAARGVTSSRRRRTRSNARAGESSRSLAAFAFGKDRRLRKRADFLRVQSNGRRVTTPHFTMLVAAQPEDSRGPSRLGIVTTRKLGGAVLRNRIRRVCREAFRLWRDFAPDGVDLVVIAREGAHELSLDDVRREWQRAHGALGKRARDALAQAASKHHVSAARPRP